MKRVIDIFRRGFLILGAVGLLSGGTISAQDASPRTVKIGYQRASVLAFLKSHGAFDQRATAAGVKVEWILFPAGPQLLEGLNAGVIDIGETGEAPPVFAQAAGVPFVYFGTEPPWPKMEGILVPKNSPIQTIADLKGKKVAFNKGSNVHYLLVKALESAGVNYSEIKPVTLPPADARAAFDGGSLDAWVVWDAYLSATQAAGGRLIADGTGLVDNLDFFLASRKFAEKYPAFIELVKEEIGRVDQWVNEHPQEAGALFSAETKIDPAIAEAVVRKHARGIRPIDEQVIAYQQNIADTFYKLGIIPKAITVKDAVLPSK